MTEADHWDTHRLRFRKDVTEGLAHASLDRDAWSTKYAGALQPGADCWLRVLANKGRADAELSIQPLQFSAEGAIADHDQASLGPTLLYALHSAQQVITAFVWNQPTDVEDQVSDLSRRQEEWA